jgi:signal peptidase I
VGKDGEMVFTESALLDLIRDLLRERNSVRYTARGFSMAPFIKDGDVLTIAPLNGSRPKRGDVVAFTPGRGSKLIIHRVIGKKGERYIIKGDSLGAVDGLFPEEDLLGKVKRVERRGKDIILGLGPEKFLLALLTRSRLLIPLLRGMQKWMGPLLKEKRTET